MHSERSVPPSSSSHPLVARRIAWVTPDYPPDRGGVSDHSSEMVQVLRAAGHLVLVCSRPHEGNFARLNDDLAAFGPGLVIVAYTPLGYAPRTGGIAPAFTLWIVGLRSRLHCQAILLAHEASLPILNHWQHREIRLAALASAQIAQFAILAANFDAVLFSNEGTQRVWARYMSYRASRFRTIRICSNIPYNSSVDPAADLTASGRVVSKRTILFFGTGHQSVLFDYVEQAFRAILEVEPSATLVLIGISRAKLDQVRHSLTGFDDRVQALGYVSSEEVSLWLQTATLVLTPLIEGVSARKGTVMAALQHGQAVVTTRGAHTRNDVPWDEICILAPLDREVFAAVAVQAFQDTGLRAAVGQAAKTEYDAHASASVTASQILEYADRYR